MVIRPLLPGEQASRANRLRRGAYRDEICAFLGESLTYQPRLEAGERCVFPGYTEPEAGSDLANLSAVAVPEGDSYVLSGQKSLRRSSRPGWTSRSRSSRQP